MSYEFGLTQARDEARAVQQHLNPLPRSVLRPGEHVLLDGEWRFGLDLEDRGLTDKWHLGHHFRHTAAWPGSVEAHLVEARLAQEHTPDSYDTIVAWYERDFEAPARWTDDADSLLQVTFGACGYETRVWLNGRPLRTVEGEEVHFGEYTSFSYELSPQWVQPVNRITVRVADSMDAEIPRGKQESRVFKRGGIWYQTYTGPVRSVWLEPVRRNRLRSRLNVISSHRDRFVAFDLTTRIHDPGMYTLRLVVAPRGGTEPLAVSEIELALEAGEKRQRVTVELPTAELWSPEMPALYGLVAQLTGQGGSSQIEARFGLRSIEARGRHVYLNGQPVYLDGILYQPGTATFAEMTRHMHAMRELGCNLVRVHIAGIDPRIYTLADESGMLLWVEVPSPHSSSTRSRDNHWAELMRMLVHIGSHPSVVCWSLYNEDWGAQDIATNPETRLYIARTYEHMRIHHPQLLVVDNDGWNHVCVEGRLHSDLLTAHLYTPELERWRGLLDRLVAGHNREVAVQPLVAGDPFVYCGQVPLVVSEWGGFGFQDYGGPADPEARAERIRAFKRELRVRPIAGDVYTQAVSIEEEDNGLIDPATGELLVPAELLRSFP